MAVFTLGFTYGVLGGTNKACFPTVDVPSFLPSFLPTHLPLAVQSFVGPWPLFHFLDVLRSRQDSLDGGSARRKVATYAQNHTNTE
jgi:hypothetical protein